MFGRICLEKNEFFCFEVNSNFVKLVKGKSDHQYDLELLTSSYRPKVVTT